MSQRRALFQAFAAWGFDERGYSPRTRRKYLLIALKAESWLIATRGISLPWARTEDLRAFLAAQPKNPRTRNNLRCGLIAFYEFLLAQGRVSFNPALSLPRLREPRSLPKPLSEAATRKVLVVASVASELAEVLILTLIYTGLRRAEVRRLEWASVDLDGGWLRVTGKGEKTRDVPIHPELIRILRGWRSRCVDARWVFPSPRLEGMPISESYLRTQVSEIGRRAGVHLHPHLFRHTFATELLRETHDLRLVQTVLGHSDPKTTAIYTLVQDADLKQGVSRLDYRRRGLDG